MIRRPGAGFWAALAWLVFPVVPTLLEDGYYGICNLSLTPFGGPDPYDWDGSRWVILVGPLLGYGFLAGATIGVPDDPDRRGVRGWLARRAVWVAVGPWVGFLAWAAIFVGYSWLSGLVPAIKNFSPFQAMEQKWPWIGWAVGWLMGIGVVATLSYGWVPLAVAAVRRAGRSGCRRRAIERGLAMALGFVGSLFGAFWALVESMRSVFFDARIVPLLLAAVGLAMVSGCASSITYGEVNRRELFHAMLLSWMIGLALLWRWWGRPRPRPPRI
jgi:hypothetical protein